MKRDRADEYAASSQPAATGSRPLAFHVGDRVRVRSTGRTGTVSYSINTDRGNFVQVRLDGDGRRTQRFLARNVSRVESLF